MHMRSTARLLGASVLLLAASAGCGDLTVEPKSTINSGTVFDDPNAYKSFLAKLYAGLAVTGQAGPDGDRDIQGIDEGFSQYLRGYWQLQTLPTDEAVIGWGDTGLPELVTQTWSSTNPFILAMYSRIFYQVALANQFLRETTDGALAGRGNVNAALKTQIQGYRNEARFLRALSYYHALDLFRNVPLVDENFDIGSLPTQGTPQQTFDFIESELKAIRGSLPATSRGDNYGRASQGAVDMVLAHLYLNSQVWTGTAKWTEARTAAEAVITSGNYSLDPTYVRLFSIDNTASQEIIFTIPFDGTRTRTWGGMTYLVHASVGDDMPPGDYGIDGGWYGLRLRPEAVDRYGPVVGPASPDARARLIVTQGHDKSIDCILNCSREGYALGKYRNKTTGGQTGSHLTHPDTDFPMFRLADAYLIYAEAVLRGGGGSAATALGYVNDIRRRAYGNNTADITAGQLDLNFILAERGRELLWEGFRRQDLVRYDLFTDNGVWEWKGNVKPGRTTDAFRDLYPIPANELSANPNIKQNTGY
jgi:starch-binding outer membrane protein, SusD/RagB family